MRNEGLIQSALLVWCAAVVVLLIGTSTVELPFRPVPSAAAVSAGAPRGVPPVAAEPDTILREPGAGRMRPIDEPPRVAATPTPAPTAVPTVAAAPLFSAPVAVPSPAPGSAEPLARWLQTTRETGLWSGPDGAATEFVKAPPGLIILAIETRGRRTLGNFGGDRDGRKPGEVWIESADLRPAPAPQWVRGLRKTSIRSEASADASELASLPPGTYVELVGEHQGRWARAFYAGDGRTPGPVDGWVDVASFAMPVIAQDTLGSMMLNRATYATTQPEVWLRVPYRSQLDGSVYAAANCGPTSVAMVLEAFDRANTPALLRTAALQYQGTPGCDTCGVFIEHLATLAEANGLPTYGLRGDKDSLRRWTVDDIRAQLRAGRVVIPQVMYRFLPGRGTSPYWGDHYIVLTGILGDRFIYNDSIDSDGNGYGRVITAEALEKAMAASDFPHAAFAAGR